MTFGCQGKNRSWRPTHQQTCRLGAPGFIKLFSSPALMAKTAVYPLKRSKSLHTWLIKSKDLFIFQELRPRRLSPCTLLTLRTCGATVFVDTIETGWMNVFVCHGLAIWALLPHCCHTSKTPSAHRGSLKSRCWRTTALIATRRLIVLDGSNKFN